jgi:hypothetical protein
LSIILKGGGLSDCVLIEGGGKGEGEGIYNYLGYGQYDSGLFGVKKEIHATITELFSNCFL